jgi:hypothetical protein
MILSLKRVFVLGVVVALVGALSVYGMKSLADRGPASVTSVVTVSPLELKLKLEKTEFMQGESINITVSLRNIGNTATEVMFSQYGSYVKFKVFDTNGNWIFEQGSAVGLAFSNIALAPNEQVSHTYTWSQVIWNRVGDTVLNEYQAPKGAYKIVGATGSDEISVVGMWPMQSLETPPIIITII